MLRIILLYFLWSQHVSGATKKKTHHTQGNTTITAHKGSQLLKLIETPYQVQPCDKELHTEHIPLRTILLH